MKRATAVLLLFSIFAVALRLAAVRGDFVLDEIWSWMIAIQCESPWQIVTYGHDNNHILNTLVLYTLEPAIAHKWLLRLPAAAASCLALWFGYRAARREGPHAGPIALVLLGLSHFLIVYGTEARGYGYLVCCTLASWWALQNFLAEPRWCWFFAFALASSLGFLAHLTFLFAYAALFVYSVVKLIRGPNWLQILLVLHAAPLATAGAVYLLYVEGMSIGGGNISPLSATLVATLSLLVGGPSQGALAYVAAAVAALLLVVALARQFRRDVPRAVLFATAIVLAPALTLLLVDPVIFYPRYFLVPVLFAYLAIAGELAHWWNTLLSPPDSRNSLPSLPSLSDSSNSLSSPPGSGAGGEGNGQTAPSLASSHSPGGNEANPSPPRPGHQRVGRLAVAGMLSAYAVCNLVPVVRLAMFGRAEYSVAVRAIADESPGPDITLAGDHDFRTAFVAYFCADQDASAFRDRGKRLAYIDRKDYPPQGTEWYLQHTFEGVAAKPDDWTDPFGNEYRLVHVFPSHSISAWTWWLYRRR